MTWSSSRTKPTFDRSRSAGPRRRASLPVIALVPGILLAAAMPAIAAQPKDSSRPAKIQTIKVWASDEKPKDEKSDPGKDALKEYRKLLEKETGKKYFTIDGKVTADEAVPGKAIVVGLNDESKLQLVPVLEGTGKDQRLSLEMSLLQKDVVKRKFNVRRFPLIYCTPIRRPGRDLVVIIQKI